MSKSATANKSLHKPKSTKHTDTDSSSEFIDNTNQNLLKEFLKDRKKLDPALESSSSPLFGKLELSPRGSSTDTDLPIKSPNTNRAPITILRKSSDRSIEENSNVKKSKSLSDIPDDPESKKVLYSLLCQFCKQNNIPIPVKLEPLTSMLIRENIHSIETLREASRTKITKLFNSFHIPEELIFLLLPEHTDGARKSRFKVTKRPGRFSKPTNSNLKIEITDYTSGSEQHTNIRKSDGSAGSISKQLPPSENSSDSKTDRSESESDEEYVDESDSESENDGDASFLINQRISSLAQLAAGLSLAGLQYDNEEDSSSEGLIDLGNQDLTLPEKNTNWQILPGSTVQITSRIGKGATSLVYSGILDNKIVAVKRIELKSFSEGIKYAQASVQREYDIIRSIDHDNIIKYFGLFYNKEKLQVNIIMELIDGVPITDLVLFCQKLSVDLSSYILKFIIEGLLSLHSLHIIHRDIKPDNALVDINATVKLIDFGTSVKCTPDTLVRKRSTVGTPWYCAPEVINTKEYSTQCDIWSLGCFAIELVSGKPPFDELNDIACLYKMAEGKPPPLPEGITAHCQDFLNKCLNPDWQHRPTISELKSHPFIQCTPTEEEHRKEQLIKIILDMKNLKTIQLQQRLKKLTKYSMIKL